jgi:tRNA G10  N-methylase Trm11
LNNYIFVTAFGNLSSAEILSYFRGDNIEARVLSTSNQVVIIESEDLNIKNLIQVLGGSYKIGKTKIVLKLNDVLNSTQITDELDSLDIYDYGSEKIKWSCSHYGNEKRFKIDLNSIIIGDITKKLRQKGVNKAKYVIPKMIEGNNYEILSDEIIRRKILGKGFEILIAYLADRVYIGKTLAVVNNQEYIDRDKGRPFQNPKLSMSPKLARVLINLAGLKPKDTLYDPFCGLGTILQEAAMIGVRFFGSDIDHKNVLRARENLKWLCQRYYVKIDNISTRIFRADARNVSKKFQKEVDGIVTEPLLIPPLKKFPRKDEAKEMLNRSEKLYRKAIKELVKILKINGRLVIVTPIIRTISREEIFFNIENEFMEKGLHPYCPNSFMFNQPFKISSDKDQKVLRGVYVLQKR